MTMKAVLSLIKITPMIMLVLLHVTNTDDGEYDKDRYTDDFAVMEL